MGRIAFSTCENIAHTEFYIQGLFPKILAIYVIKNIFKKYGWTVQVVVLAAGLVIGAVSLAALNALKAGTKAVGNGLKAIGKKVASILPGLIGTIVGFIFKTAGQVVSFLGEHAWLLILAVVAFLIERLLKKRRKQ